MKKLEKKSVILGLALGLTLIYSTGSMATGSIELMKNKGVTVLTAGEAISHRQSAFALIERDAKQVGNELKVKEVNWDLLEQSSKLLYEASLSLESLFPEGSLEGSKAKNKVWQNKARFERLLNEMDDGFLQLYQAALKEDKEDAAQQGLKQAQSTCKACHRQYRSRW